MIALTERENQIVGKYEFMANTSMDGFWILDTTGRILFANKVLAEMSGYRHGALAKMHLRDMEASENEATLLSHLASIRITGHDRFESRLFHKNGHRTDVEISVAFLAEDNIYLAYIRDLTDRKRYENSLRDSEARYRALFDNSLDAILLIESESDGVISAANPAACAMFGMTEEELRRAGRAGIVDPGCPGFSAALEERAATGVVRCELTCLRKDATRFSAEVTSTLLDNADRSFVILRDISERIWAEAALRKGEERYRLLAETMLQGVLHHDAAGKLISVNPAAERMLGKGCEGFLGSGPLQEGPRTIFESGENFPGPEHPTELALRTGLPVHGVVMGVFQPKTSDYLWILIDAVPVSAPGEAQLWEVYTVFEEITERKLAGEHAQLQAERLRLALDAAHLATWNWHIPSDTVAWNSQSFRMLGYEPDSFPPTVQHWIDRVHPEDFSATYARLQQSLQEGGDYRTEFRVVWQNGTVRTLEALGRVDRDPSGLPLCLFGVMNDITERKQMIGELQSAKANLEHQVAQRTVELEEAVHEMEAFSYSVSHDLRAPLRHINSFSTILCEDYGAALPAGARNYLERIRGATRSMGGLIDHLLELSRVSRADLKREKIDLSSLAREVSVMLLETEPERRAEFIVAAGMVARGDRDLLKQLLQNLIGNAWKYSSVRPLARIEFGGSYRDGQQVFFVKDNGAGFDMAYSSKLFQIFQRLHGTEFEGTGIGLATVQRIIQRHGGSIWADGKVGEGASFYFTLSGASPGRAHIQRDLCQSPL